MSTSPLPTHGSTARALVVDDEPLLTDLISEWVMEKWACETANSGSEALDRLDDSFDIVLLDRQMPDVSGEEVLDEIRKRGLPTQVMMVSGVEPDFDIVELPIDDYLKKPVDRPELQEKIEQLLMRRTYHPNLQKFFICVAKLDQLEKAKSATELTDDERYLTLKAEADKLRQEANATLGEMTEHVSEFHDVNADD